MIGKSFFHFGKETGDRPSLRKSLAAEGFPHVPGGDERGQLVAVRGRVQQIGGQLAVPGDGSAFPAVGVGEGVERRAVKDLQTRVRGVQQGAQPFLRQRADHVVAYREPVGRIGLICAVLFVSARPAAFRQIPGAGETGRKGRGDKEGKGAVSGRFGLLAGTGFCAFRRRRFFPQAQFFYHLQHFQLFEAFQRGGGITRSDAVRLRLRRDRGVRADGPQHAGEFGHVLIRA